jgi:hypothetical protein
LAADSITLIELKQWVDRPGVVYALTHFAMTRVKDNGSTRQDCHGGLQGQRLYGIALP